MTAKGSDVVIVGGGIVGMATAYFLGKAGLRCMVVERDSVGSHASGFAFGELTPLSGAGIPGPVYPLALEGIRLHTELAQVLPQETGVNTQFRRRPSITLAFTEQEAERARAHMAWQQRQPGFKVEWLEPAGIRSLDARISPQALGGVYVEGGGDVEPYRLVLALAQAAEKLGATIRHGRATGLRRQGSRVSAVVLESGEVPCQRAVLCMGPWSGEASAWLGTTVGVRPLRGQILRLRAPGPPLEYAVFWAGNYATTNADGLLWSGTNEEDVGFQETATSEARDSIMASLLKMLPPMRDAQLVQQTACLRPLASDGLPVLGAVPGWEGVYLATGAGRKGILLGPAMARIITDLLTSGKTDIPIEALGPGRHGQA